jgi:excinuclease ABC subunit A
VVIEHNLDVIKCADWIVDMGPGAGVHGGEIVFTGTPEELAATAKVTKSAKKRHAPVEGISVTASYLKESIENSVIDAGSRTRQENRQDTGPNVSATSAEEAVTVEPPKVMTNSATEVVSVEPPALTDPWQVLGRRWHSLGKGFPEGEQPEWPLEIADETMKLIESVAGDDSLSFDSPEKVTVKLNGSRYAWATIETKTSESLKVTLAGPPEAIDEDGLPSLRIDRPKSQGKRTKITLNLTESKHVRSRKLKSFLKSHLAASVE